ncbi:MAG: hypothetical protein JWR74_2245 [Polaromonas sp.]|jgi:hypothetical protein|nr:hypothetical protein [Polaromonas sp.]
MLARSLLRKFRHFENFGNLMKSIYVTLVYRGRLPNKNALDVMVTKPLSCGGGTLGCCPVIHPEEN